MSSAGADEGPARGDQPAERSPALLRAEVGPGVRLALKVPVGAREEPESALPIIEVAGLPGASVTLRRGFVGDDGVTLRAACVRGPSDRWAPGVEELVLGRATAIAHRALGADLDRWAPGPVEVIGGRFEQRLEGAGRARGEAITARGRHILGFAGGARDAVLCSIVCAEPAPLSASKHVCAELIDAALPEGSFTEAPPPSVLIRAILFAAARPLEAGVAGALFAALVVGFVLARRPRPRR